MPTLDEQFAEWAAQEIRLRSSRYNIRKSVAHDAFLAGAAAEQERVLAMLPNSNLRIIKELERRIRQRGEEGK